MRDDFGEAFICCRVMRSQNAMVFILLTPKGVVEVLFTNECINI